MIPTNGFLFQRPDLARQIAEDLRDAPSAGTFLAGPRGAGKTTFLKADLIPAFRAMGWLPLYVDLNRDKGGTPGVGIERALDHLERSRWETAVLVIDDAHLACSGPQGITSLQTLRAVLDGFDGRNDSTGIRVVFCGTSVGPSFAGVPVQRFPMLEDDFAASYAAHENARLRPDNRFRVRDVIRAFAMLDNQPARLRQLIEYVGQGIAAAPRLRTILGDQLFLLRAGVWRDFESLAQDLSLGERAVIEAITLHSKTGKPFLPFAERTIQDVAGLMIRMGAQIRPGTRTIKQALDDLCAKGLILRSALGEFSADPAFSAWLEDRPSTAPTGCNGQVGA